MDKDLALREIMQELSTTASHLSSTAASLSRHSVLVSGVPTLQVPTAGAPPAGAPPLGVPKLGENELEIARALARDAATVAFAAPKVAGAVPAFSAVPFS